MKDLEWKDEYLLGIAAVDLQHQGIFDCFVAIAETGLSKQDRSLADSYMVQLVDLFQQHFALEESMLRGFGYPELDRHIEEHLQCRAEVRDLTQWSVRANASVSRETIKLAQKWLRQHNMTSDRHYMEYFSGPSRNSAGKKPDGA